MSNDSSKLTCYSYLGTAYGNNTRCPQSDSCCETAAQCREDRLCTSNDDSDILIRSLCANYPWTLSTCAQICLYDNPTGFLPRVTKCIDGSYCCDDDPTCCVAKRGFFLNSDGVVTALANSTSTMTSSATTSTSGLPASAMASTTGTSGPSPSSLPANTSPGLSTPAKAGIGVGVTLGVLLIACLGFFIGFNLRRRRSHHETPQPHQDPQPYHIYGGFSELKTGAPLLQAPTDSPSPSYYHSSQPSQPTELPSDNGEPSPHRER